MIQLNETEKDPKLTFSRVWTWGCAQTGYREEDWHYYIVSLSAFQVKVKWWRQLINVAVAESGFLKTASDVVTKSWNASGYQPGQGPIRATSFIQCCEEKTGLKNCL